MATRTVPGVSDALPQTLEGTAVSDQPTAAPVPTSDLAERAHGVLRTLVGRDDATFREDLRSHPGVGVERLAVAGHVAKGAALALVGVLFCVAGVRRSTGPAGGLDSALKTLREAPLGPYLLTAVGLGIAAYGAYCFARARYARL